MSRGLVERGLVGLLTSLLVLRAGGLLSTLLLLLALSSKVAVGLFWSFFHLLSRICPNCAHTQLFLAPYSFFDSMDMNLSKLREMMKDREAWNAAVREAAKS